jgi:predicted MPP superfamily phosphohydrolase
MPLEFITLLLLTLGMTHLWWQLMNRVFSYVRDSKAKPWLHAAAFVLLVPVPVMLLIIYRDAAHVHEAMTWLPRRMDSWILFLMIAGTWLLLLWRGSLWFLDRIIPRHSGRVISRSVSQPRLHHPPSPLPIILRPWDTTWDLEITELEIQVPGLPAVFDGMRVCLFSDMQYETLWGQGRYFREVVAAIQDIPCDVMVLGGDFVNRRQTIAASSRLHARLRGRLNTIAVMGNHDYWTNPVLLRRELESHGIQMLHNRRWSLERAGRRLTFAGSDAPWGGRRTDWEDLLARETNETVIVVTHTPDNAPIAARHGASLVLSGHTHGGQVLLPLLGPMYVPCRRGHEYLAGAYDIGEDCVLVVSRGVGISSSRILGGGRTLCPPEVIYITLRAEMAEIAIGEQEQAMASKRVRVSDAPGYFGSTKTAN